MSNVFKLAWPVLFKTILPSVLSAVGVVAAALYSDGFRAFCGLN